MGALFGEESTEILDEDLTAGDNISLISDESLAVLESLLGGGIEKANLVKVLDASSLGDHNLDIFNSGLVVQLDRGGQGLDGFLGC